MILTLHSWWMTDKDECSLVLNVDDTSVLYVSVSFSFFLELGDPLRSSSRHQSPRSCFHPMSLTWFISSLADQCKSSLCWDEGLKQNACTWFQGLSVRQDTTPNNHRENENVTHTHVCVHDGPVSSCSHLRPVWLWLTIFSPGEESVWTSPWNLMRGLWNVSVTTKTTYEEEMRIVCIVFRLGYSHSAVCRQKNKNKKKKSPKVSLTVVRLLLLATWVVPLLCRQAALIVTCFLQKLLNRTKPCTAVSGQSHTDRGRTNYLLLWWKCPGSHPVYAHTHIQALSLRTSTTDPIWSLCGL